MRFRGLNLVLRSMAASGALLMVLLLLGVWEANVALGQEVPKPVKYSARIVRGQKAPKSRFDFMISLVNSYHTHVCGAVLIDPEWALTAAHCVHPEVSTAVTLDASLVVGAYNIEADDHVSGLEVIKVAEIYVHENYQANQEPKGWDIAVLKLAKPSTMTPVPLPNSNPDLSGTEVLALGWGENSEILQQIELEVKKEDECKKAYPELGPNIICAVSDKGDTCTGDSGGPILVPDSPDGSIKAGSPDLDSLVGLISFGDEDCEALEYPGGYTLVAPYLDWIKGIMNGITTPQVVPKPPSSPGLPTGCEGNSTEGIAARASCAKVVKPKWNPKAVTYEVLPKGTCQGILVHPYWIVTSGECLVNSGTKQIKGSVKVAGLASLRRKEVEGEAFVNPSFLKIGMDNVGLIKLSTRQDGMVYPVVPWRSKMPIDSKNLTALIFDGKVSKVREVTVDQMDVKECGGAEEMKRKVCAGAASSLLCLSGTSGAPLLQASRYNAPMFVGILHSGPPSCSSSSAHPVTYQRVDNVVDWIRITIATK